MGRAAMTIPIVLTLAACTDGITAPDDPPDVEGVIFEFGETPLVGGESVPTVWVKSDPDDECGTVHTILDSTDPCTRGPDGKVREIELEALRIGSVVRVWWRRGGPIQDSCPGFASARSLKLVSG